MAVLGHVLVTLDPSSCTTVWRCECGHIGLVVEGDEYGRTAAMEAHWLHTRDFAQRDRGAPVPQFQGRGSRIDHERDARIGELFADGRTWVQIAAEVGLSQSGVASALRRLGLSRRAA